MLAERNSEASGFNGSSNSSSVARDEYSRAAESENTRLCMLHFWIVDEREDAQATMIHA